MKDAVADPSKFVEVAVAVIEGPKRSVLLAQRPAGKPMPGYWEFPGGKLEPGESIFQALQREINEELGLDISRATPWVTLPFIYPHATVRLHFMRVLDWQGRASSREQQAFRFEPIDQLSTEPWLAAALPLKRWLRVPSFYAISNASELGLERFIAQFEARAKREREPWWLLLREPALDEVAFAALQNTVMPLARRHGVRVLISSRHAQSCWYRADGVHLTAADLAAQARRPPVQWCLASCHDQADLLRAAALGCDAAMLGAVEATASHPARLPLGWSGFVQMIEHTPLPVFALGGMRLDPASLQLARSHGAHGVAAQRAAWD